MTPRSASGALYTPEMLVLAVDLAAFPSDPDAGFHGAARSTTCGGSIALDFSLAGDRVDSIGLLVSACAVGQASAALFARWAKGQPASGVLASGYSVAAWLSGDPPPEAIDLAPIAVARDYPARHGAILLPWRAFADALGKPDPAR